MSVAHAATITWLEERLKQELPGHSAHARMLARVRAMPHTIPATAKPSAVLGLLFPQGADLNLVLIQRTEDGRAHSGQISFPGGRQEPFDADLRATALREAQEEIGVLSSEVNILGQLTPLYIPVSNFLVYPFIGFCNQKPTYNVNQHEVARVLELSVRELLDAETRTISTVVSSSDKSFVREVDAYKLADGSIVWGATAMMLSELEMILLEHFT